VTAPYAGVVSSIAAEVGDMAVPGKPLVTVYDPAALRVVAAVPERYVPLMKRGAAVKLELPGASDDARSQIARSVVVLPTRDPASHTVQVRLELAPRVPLAPGAFARAYFPLTTAEEGALTIPLSAVVRRTELTAVYVAAADGRFHLRQVRLGRVSGDRVVVLAGLSAGERVALDPVAASRQ
jgi:RND family efflux transporter MFP subunit